MIQEINKGKLILLSPEYEIIFNDKTIHTGRLVPIYPETKGISSKWLRRQIYNILEKETNIEDFLPQEIIEQNKLINLKEAINNIHFPQNLNQIADAKYRLSFDELFNIQLLSLFRKKEWQKQIIKKPNSSATNRNYFMKTSFRI